jgi:hypothetical protein
LLLDAVVPLQFLTLYRLQRQDRFQCGFTCKYNFRWKNPSPSRIERTIGKDITRIFAVWCYMLHNLAIVAFKSQTSSQKLCTVDCDMFNWQAVFPVGFLALWR